MKLQNQLILNQFQIINYGTKIQTDIVFFTNGSGDS
jgi:hypothetical protein